jgi:hypothetical protein
MAIRRTGHRYRDVDTGRTIDVWFTASGDKKIRHCLAEKVGLISGGITSASAVCWERTQALGSRWATNVSLKPVCMSRRVQK